MKDGPGPPPMNRRRVLSPRAPPTPAGGRRRGSTLSPKVLYTGPAKRRYRNAIDAHARWNAGQAIIQVLHISVKEARLAPRRDHETAYSAHPPLTPSTPPAPLARAASDGDEENRDYVNVAEL